MNMESIASRVVGFIFIFAALAFIAGLLYTEGPWILRSYTWTSATGIIEEMSENSGESMLTITVREQDQRSRTATIKEYIDSDSDLYVGKEVDLIYEPGRPSEIYFKTNVPGIVIGLFFAAGFGYVGLLLCYPPAKRKFDHWNRGYRLLWPLLIALGILASYLAVNPGEPSDDSAITTDSIWLAQLIYGLFAFVLIFAGIAGIYKLKKGSQKRNQLLQRGRRIETSDYEVIKKSPTQRRGQSEETLFIIRCKAPEPGTNIPFVFDSEPLHFDPTPFLNSTVTILVHPTDVTEYMVQTEQLLSRYKESAAVSAGS